MIRYNFTCADNHEFEAWFRNAAACDEQIAARLVSCAVCGSSDVRKALMAPAVGTKSNRKADVTADASQGGAPEAAQDAVQEAGQSPGAAGRLPMMSGGMGDEARKLVHAMRTFRKTVTKHADYVGPQFAEEARKIHFGESQERGIYGEATPDEAKKLSEEGVDIVPLPILPEDQN
jgi:hypothetical protein